MYWGCNFYFIEITSEYRQDVQTKRQRELLRDNKSY